MEYKVGAVLAVLVLIEATHSTLVGRLRSDFPMLFAELGRTGPGYYFFGLFWFAPQYRRALTSGNLESGLHTRPGLRRLASTERILWYLMWVTVLLAVLI